MFIYEQLWLSSLRQVQFPLLVALRRTKLLQEKSHLFHFYILCLSFLNCLRQGGYVSVCLSVCVCVLISQKLMKGFDEILWRGKNRLDFGGDLILGSFSRILYHYG